MPEPLQPAVIVMKPSSLTAVQPQSEKVAEADDLHISPFRQDGATYGTPPRDHGLVWEMFPPHFRIFTD